MNAGVKYGLLLAVEMFALLQVAPQPWGGLAFWLLQATQLTIYTAVTWHRTRLVISTAGGAVAALACMLLLVLHASGYTLTSLPGVWAIPVYGLIVLVPLSVIVEARIHRAAWAEWNRHMEGMGLLDLLLLRHIPKLRRRGA
jgi:presenilin-like A22 family membrane protease